MCTVFAVYDMCKDELRRYPLLTRAASKKKYVKGGDGRGDVDLSKETLPYWYIAGADVKKGVDAKSVLAEAMLRRMEDEGAADGIVSFPGSWIGF